MKEGLPFPIGVEVCTNPFLPKGFSMMKTPTQIAIINHETGKVIVLEKDHELMPMLSEILKVEVK